MTRRSTHGLDVLPDEKDWRQHAACRRFDPEMFFPRDERARLAVEAAKAVCSGCDVRPECLAYALDRERNFGVWGGLTAEERRHLKERR